MRPNIFTVCPRVLSSLHANLLGTNHYGIVFRPLNHRNEIMKKAITLIASAALLLSAIAPALAQKKGPPSPTSTSSKSSMPAHGQMSLNGMVKGKVNGKLFTLATRKGNYEVDCAKATVKGKDGKFMKLSALTGGSNVTVLGDVAGMKCKAKTVTVNMLNGSKLTVPGKSKH